MSDTGRHDKAFVVLGKKTNVIEKNRRFISKAKVISNFIHESVHQIACFLGVLSPHDVHKFGGPRALRVQYYTRIGTIRYSISEPQYGAHITETPYCIGNVSVVIRAAMLYNDHMSPLTLPNSLPILFYTFFFSISSIFSIFRWDIQCRIIPGTKMRIEANMINHDI